MTRLQSPSRLITPVALLIGLGCYVFTASADATEEDISRINRSIFIAAGLTVGDVSTVNGGIRLSAAAIAGEVHIVNGSIELGARARVDSAETVNGDIGIGEEVIVNGAVSTVNGNIAVNAGSEIERNIETINGEILLENSRIGGDLETANGDVTLLQGATVEGDIIIDDQRGWWNKLFSGNSRPLKLVIDEKSSVKGRIHLYREVELHIDPAAEVGELIEHF
jgi:hypothetical protein